MDNAYYTLDNGTQQGPYTFDELTAMELDVHTRVLSAGGIWQDACDLPELFEYFEARGVNFPTEDNLASFWWRLLAYIVDCVLLSFVLAFMIELLAGYGVQFNVASYNDLIRLQLIFYVVLIVYNSVCEATPMKGTLGKKLCGLVVVDADGVTLSYFNSLYRNLGKAVSLYFFGLGFLSIFWSEYRQALHDYVAKTYVVKL